MAAFLFLFSFSLINYLPFDLDDLETAPPLLADLEVVFAVEALLFSELLFAELEAGLLLFAVLAAAGFDVLPLVFDEDAALVLVFAGAAVLAVFATVFAFAAFASAAFAPSLSSKPPTASAATFSALSAAPVAAPTRISPATSLAVSTIGDDAFFVDFFGAADFDFVESALFAADFDFAGDAFFAVVDF